MKLMRFLMSLCVLSCGILLNSQEAKAASCWASQGGDGNTWLEVKVTAGGNPVQDVSVYIQPKSYGNKGYAYESRCTDANGKTFFKLETSPAANCISSYTYKNSDGVNVTTSYCNGRSAHCANYCYGNSNLDSWYSTKSLELDNYEITAYPPYGSTLAERYGKCTISNISLLWDGAPNASCELAEKTQILRVKIEDDEGVAVKSDVTLWLSGSTSVSKTVSASFTDFYVVPDENTWIGGYCTNYQSCSYACIGNKNVSVKSNETIKTITLKAKKNSSTIYGTVTGSDGTTMSGASVSVYSDYSADSNSDSCYAYGWVQTDSRGGYSISIPGGTTYNISSYPNWTSSGSNYAGKDGTLSLAPKESKNYDITLVKKDSAINVAVKDSEGNALESAYISAWAYDKGNNSYAWGETNAQGSGQLSVLTGKHNVQASYWQGNTTGSTRSISNCPNEGAQAIEAPADVSFTFSVLDHLLNIAFVDSSGNTISGLSGGASIRPAEAGSSWCSDWASIDSGTVKKLVGANAKWLVEGWVYGGSTYVPKETSATCTAGASGGSSTCNIEMISLNKTLKGNFVDGDGNIISPDDGNSLYISANRGTIWQTVTVSDSSYSVPVSSGRWCLNSWMGWGTNWASRPVATCKTISDSDTTVEQDLVFLPTGKINVSLSPVHRWVWVEASVYSADEYGKNDETRRYYESNGCSTNAEGKCTITVASKTRDKGGLKYYVNVHRPMDAILEDGYVSDGETEVISYAAEEAGAPVVLRQLDADIQVNILVGADAVANVSKNIALPHPIKNASATTEEDLKNDAFISCFSDLGGATQATSSNGAATLKATSGDIWHCFAVNELGNKIYISEEGEITVNANTNTMNLKLNYVGDISENYTATWDASVANTIKLSDNYSETYPAGSLAESGLVTCSVQPTARLPYLAGKRPTCLYGYDSVCSDSSGNEIKTMRSKITLCMPLCEAQLSKLDLEAEEINFSYYDPSNGTYIAINDATIDSTTNIACGQLDHKTEFALVGNGNLSGVDGDTENASEEADRTGETASGATGGSGCGSCHVAGISSEADAFWFTVFSLIFILWRRSMRKVTVDARKRSR